MRFMNEWDIELAVKRWASHPVLGPATRFLNAFKDEVNAHSDGWPYWAPAAKSAAKLMALIEDRGEAATAAELRAALAPVKAFMTRRGRAAGMSLPALEG